MSQIIFHIDVNSAFLSWSALQYLEENPETDLRLIPSIVGGDIEKRHGVVLAKSIPAKVYGIETGEPVVNAFRKCPALTMVPPDHDMYSEKSKQLMQYLSGICPEIEQASIDECYMDFTPIAHLYTSPEEAAETIKEEVFRRFGFTVNIGISDKKVLAKMASDFKKPHLVHTLYSHEIKEKLWPLPISALYMCGKSSVENLRKLEILTIGDLANMDLKILTSHMKSHGILLWNYANGIDDTPVITEPTKRKGVGTSTTVSHDVTTREEAARVLLSLAESVGKSLRASGEEAMQICTEIKYSSFKSVSHQMSLDAPTSSNDVLYKAALSLFDAIWDHSPIRLLGVRTTKLVEEGAPVQMSIFDIASSQKASGSLSFCTTVPGLIATGSTSSASSVPSSITHTEKLKKLDAALDQIRDRYGNRSIVRGSMLSSKEHPAQDGL